MIIAEMNIQTCYGDCMVQVQILNAGPRPNTAWVEALNGLTPFLRYTHGGPCQVSNALVWVSQLRNVQIVKQEGIPVSEDNVFSKENISMEVAG
jgi:hypothetical protein